MSSLTSCTLPARTRTLRPPSPSTRARAFTVIVRTLLMELALLAERLGARVERTEGAHEARRRNAESAPEGRERGGVRRLHRPEASEAAAVEGRAQRVAARLRDGAEARRPVRDHDARRAAPLALETDARGGRHGLAAGEKRAHDLEKLGLRDGAAAQLEVDEDVVSDRCRLAEDLQKLRGRVDGPRVVADVREVAQRLDPARRRAGADRHE